MVYEERPVGFVDPNSPTDASGRIAIRYGEEIWWSDPDSAGGPMMCNQCDWKFNGTLGEAVAELREHLKTHD